SEGPGPAAPPRLRRARGPRGAHRRTRRARTSLPARDGRPAGRRDLRPRRAARAPRPVAATADRRRSPRRDRPAGGSRRGGTEPGRGVRRPGPGRQRTPRRRARRRRGGAVLRRAADSFPARAARTRAGERDGEPLCRDRALAALRLATVGPAAPPGERPAPRPASRGRRARRPRRPQDPARRRPRLGAVGPPDDHRGLDRQRGHLLFKLQVGGLSRQGIPLNFFESRALLAPPGELPRKSTRRSTPTGTGPSLTGSLARPSRRVARSGVPSNRRILKVPSQWRGTCRGEGTPDRVVLAGFRRGAIDRSLGGRVAKWGEVGYSARELKPRTGVVRFLPPHHLGPNSNPSPGEKGPKRWHSGASTSTVSTPRIASPSLRGSEQRSPTALFSPRASTPASGCTRPRSSSSSPTASSRRTAPSGAMPVSCAAASTVAPSTRSSTPPGAS